MLIPSFWRNARETCPLPTLSFHFILFHFLSFPFSFRSPWPPATAHLRTLAPPPPQGRGLCNGAARRQREGSHAWPGGKVPAAGMRHFRKADRAVLRRDGYHSLLRCLQRRVLGHSGKAAQAGGRSGCCMQMACFKLIASLVHACSCPKR